MPQQFAVLTARQRLLDVPLDQRRALLAEGERVLRPAGMTWEQVAGWLQEPLEAAAWEALIPSVGYMALLRNLRNVDEAGVPDEVATRVAATLADRDEAARSRQLPLRFLSAFRTAPSLRWAWRWSRRCSTACPASGR